MVMGAPRTVAAPKTGGWSLPPVLREGTASDLAERGLQERVRFCGLDLSGLDLSGSTFEECELQRLGISEANLQAAHWLRTVAGNLQIPALNAHRIGMRQVRLDACRFGGADLAEAQLDNVVISGSKFTWLSLQRARLRDVLLRDCAIEELDLSQCRIERLAFENVKVGTMHCAGAKMRHVDLRGAQLQSLSGLESLRGTVVNPAQLQSLAELFAVHFGITVRD